MAFSRAVVVGSGSIGRRHMRNLRSLGIGEIAAVDPDTERLQPMIDELGVKPYADLLEALAEFKPDIVLVCSPPIMHTDHCLAAVRAGAHVFVEKPLASSLEGLEDLIDEAVARKLHVQVGYNMRYNPGLIRVKELINSGKFGKPWWARAEIGQYLPDWRPWQDYRQSYTARRELGGGIILDSSHELDYVTWMLGKPVEIVAMAGRVSNLEMNVEDCATVLMRFANGVQADVHLDAVQRTPSRNLKVVCSEGTIEWDGPSKQVRTFSVASGEWETQKFDFDPNDMYVAEVAEFLELAETEPSIDSLEEGVDVLKMALQARDAARLEVSV